MAIQTQHDLIGPHDDPSRSQWDGQRMSLEQFLALPEEKPALEFVEGVVRQKMAAKPVHGAIQTFLTEVINHHARPRRLGIALSETRFTNQSWSPVPDVAFYRRESLTVRRAPRDFTAAPDLAIEILSPGQTVTELIEKCLSYLARGTTVALLVHPDEESVFQLRAGGTIQVATGESLLDLEDVLPGFRLSAHDLFQSVNWDWLDTPPEIDPAAPQIDPATHGAAPAQADDAAASGRSEG